MALSAVTYSKPGQQPKQPVLIVRAAVASSNMMMSRLICQLRDSEAERAARDFRYAEDIARLWPGETVASAQSLPDPYCAHVSTSQ